MKNPLVSFLLPMHNAKEGVRLTLESILRQTIKDFEVIIVDDGSTDNSVEIALATYSQAKIIRQKNTGITGALNHGLTHCRGVYVARIDCFDIASPDRLELQLESLEASPEIGAIGGHIILYENNQDIGLCKYPLTEDEIELEILSGNCPLPHSGATLRNSVLRKVGSYDTFYNGREDFELWTRLSLVSRITNVNATIMRILSTRSGISFDGGKLSPLVTLALMERKARKIHGWSWKDKGLRAAFQKSIPSVKKESLSKSEENQLSAIFYSKRAGFILKSGNKKIALREYVKAINCNPTHIKAWLGIVRALVIPTRIDGWAIKTYKIFRVGKVQRQKAHSDEKIS